MIKNVKLKVVGVTFEGRQEIIKQLNKNDVITIRREPSNRFDINAIAVWSEKGQVGYIGKDYATILAPMMDAGTKFEATIAELDEYKNTHYIHILINEIGPKDSTQLSGGHLW